MDNNIAVEFRNVSKVYRLKDQDASTLFRPKTRDFYALRNVSFQIKKGQVVGILGTNGSGKSTLSRLIAEIAFPDEGEVIVNGESALSTISTGLKSQLTGMENIRLKGAMLGLPRKTIDELAEGVVDFSELGEFMYQPVKKYSSGMKSRLGFSINLCLNPDIMIIDEALSVGDKTFSKKCIARMKELKETGKTIIFVSHSLNAVRNFCDSCIWLEGGILKEVGPSEIVCKHYFEYAESVSALSKADKKAFLDGKFATRIGKGVKKTGKKKGTPNSASKAKQAQKQAETAELQENPVEETPKKRKPQKPAKQAAEAAKSKASAPAKKRRPAGEKITKKKTAESQEE